MKGAPKVEVISANDAGARAPLPPAPPGPGKNAEHVRKKAKAIMRGELKGCSTFAKRLGFNVDGCQGDTKQVEGLRGKGFLVFLLPQTWALLLHGRSITKA